MSLKPEFRKWLRLGGVLLVLLVGMVAWLLRDARQLDERLARQTELRPAPAQNTNRSLLSQSGNSNEPVVAIDQTPTNESSADIMADALAAARVAASNTAASTAGKTNAADAAKLAKYLADEKKRFPHRLRNTDRPLNELIHQDNMVLLHNAFIDVNKLANYQVPAALTSREAPAAYIVHAGAGVDQQLYSLLHSVNADVISYLPNNNLLAAMSSQAAQSLTSSRSDLTLLNYEPFYKLPEPLLAVALDGAPLPTEMLRITAMPGRDQQVQSALQSAGAQVVGQDRTPFGDQFVIKPGGADVVSLARLTDVLAVDTYSGRKIANDLTRVTLGIATNTLAMDEEGGTNYLGLTGQGILVNLNDTGVDVGHPDLAGRVTTDVPSTALDFDGHGTHVAGTIASSGENSPDLSGAQISLGSTNNANFRGMAPQAYIFAQPISLVTGPLLSDTYLQENAAKTNALVSNNSWGYVGAYDYNFAAASYDAAVRDALPEQPGSQMITYVFAAGNDGFGNDEGLGGEAGSIVAPGTAKNVITVGALESFRNLTNSYITTNIDLTSGMTNTVTNTPFLNETDSSNLVVSFSSRGNVGVGVEGDYGRFKPDVVAPGSFIISTRSQYWSDPQNFTYVKPSYYNDLVIKAQGTNANSLYVANNVSLIRIRAVANSSSPTPFPDLAIYAGASGDTLVNYGNNDVVFPVTSGFWNYEVVNPTDQDVHYDLQVFQYVTANDDGYFTELKKLNDELAPYYRFESGTSMATPAVTGYIALMYQFFIEKFGMTNSPALMKALLINGSRSTDNIYSYGVQDFINYQGWGRPDLKNSIPSTMGLNSSDTNSWPMRFFEQDPQTALSTGQEQTRFLSVNTNGQFYPLRVTLVWTDPPGNPIAALKLVNDLDLIVTNYDDPANPKVYYGNNFQGGLIYTEEGTNAPPDSVNNVENVFIERPLGTNYSVTVRARRVSVNAVTANPDQIAQDYALVISLGNSSLTNGFKSFTDIPHNPPAPATQNPTVPVTVKPLGNGIPLDKEIVSANPPYLQTTNGAVSQWNFYTITNTFATTNMSYTNFAVATYLPANASRQRTMLEGDLDLYLTTDPGLTNLTAAAIAGARKSVNQGGNEAIQITDAVANQVYYIGVKSEDQQAVEYGLIAAFSDTPFTDCNNLRCVLRPIMPANPAIPDGSPDRPQALPVIFPGPVEQVDVRRVLMTNTLTHESPADLVGTLGHGQDFATLYNHSYPNDLLNIGATRTVVYDDSEEEFGTGFIDIPRKTTDGPGSLRSFNGKEGRGPWQYFAIDNSLNFTGRVDAATVVLEKMPLLDDFRFSLADGGGYRVATNVGPGAVKLTITVSNIVGDLNVFVRRGDPPTPTLYDKKALLSPTGGVLELTARDVPPLTPGLYHILFLDVVDGIPQPDVHASVKVEYDLITDNSKDFTSDGNQPLIDDARTNSIISVTNFQQIATIDVGLRINHERAADLSVYLTSPQGTSVLLTENRGRTNTLGYGEGGPNTETLKQRYLEDFEIYRKGTYTNGETFGPWMVTADDATMRYSPSNAYNGFRFVSLSGGGVISNSLETVSNSLYELSYAHRAPDSPAAIPIAWYQLESNTVDSAGSNTAVAIGSPTYVAGKVGLALSMSGPSDYVEVPPSSTLNVGVGDGFTVDAWVNPTDVATPRPIVEWNNDNITGPNAGVGVHFWLAQTAGAIGGSGSLFADLVDVAGVSHPFASAQNVVQADVYQHVALTYDRLSGMATMYLGGVQVAQTNIGNIPLQTSYGLYFGHRPNGGSLVGATFAGGLDEIGLYDHALSACEIGAIVTADSGGRGVADFAGCALGGGVQVTVNDSVLQSVVSGPNWQVASLRFTATNSITPLRFQGLPSGVGLDYVQLVEVITNAPIVYTRFSDNTNLSLLPIKFGNPPYANDSIYIPLLDTEFESATAGDYPAVAPVEDGWTVITNSSAVINDPGLAFDDAALEQEFNDYDPQFLALADGRLSLSNVPVNIGTEYNLTVTYRDNGILSWWPGDDTAGDIMELNSGLLVPPATYSTGLVRRAFEFSGAKPGRVTFGDPESLRFAGGAFTVEGWVNLASLPVGQVAPIIARGDDNGLFPYYVGVQPGGALVFHVASTTNSMDLVGPTIAPGTWTHFGAVLDNISGAMRLYVDGSPAPVASTNITFRPVVDLNPQDNPEVAIGSRGPAIGAVAGQIDELTVYDRALSASEIGAVFRAGADGKSGPTDPPQPESTMQVIINNSDTNSVVGSRLWAQQTYHILAISNTMSFDLVGNPQAMLVDSLGLTETRSFNHYLAEETLNPFIGQNAGGDWKLTVWDNRVGAPVDARLISWTMNLLFANTNAGCIPLTHAVPVTNSVPAGGWQYYCVDVPRSASYATNFLTSVDGPVDLWYSPDGLPDTAIDTQFMSAANDGVATLATNQLDVVVNGAPYITGDGSVQLQPGQRYYLGVHNPGATDLNVRTKVEFDLIDGITRLTNGVRVVKTIQPGQELDFFQLDVSSNATELAFEILGPQGDVDLLVQQGPALPGTDHYDFQDGIFDNGVRNKQVVVTTNMVPTMAGTRWFVAAWNQETNPVPYEMRVTEIYGYDPATVDPAVVSITPLADGVAASGTQPAGVSLTNFYQYTISATNPAVLFEVYGASDDVDMLVRRDMLPSILQSDFQSTRTGLNPEQIVLRTNSFPTDLNGDWYIGVPNQSFVPATFQVRAVVPNAAGIIIGGEPPTITGLTLVVVSTNSFVEFSFNSIEGEHYEIQTATSLTAPITWTPIATLTAPGPVTTFQDTTPIMPGPIRFYRIQQVP